MRYKIKIEYDGTNYLGWQAQPDQPERGIEDVLQNAIFKLSGQKVKINCAGRTDSGVHALGQIADFSLEKEFQAFKVMMALNNHLGNQDIAITDCEIVQDAFHSRYDAKMRHYQYRIINRRAPVVMEKNRAWHLPTPLNLEKMKKAGQEMLGKHDFSAFRDSKCQALSPIKTINNLEIEKNNDEILFSISAKSFLHHMVRNIVGTLVLCGVGKIDPGKIAKIINSKDRTKSGPNAPAHGLYFVGVDY